MGKPLTESELAQLADLGSEPDLLSRLLREHTALKAANEALIVVAGNLAEGLRSLGCAECSGSGWHQTKCSDCGGSGWSMLQRQALRAHQELLAGAEMTRLDSETPRVEGTVDPRLCEHEYEIVALGPWSVVHDCAKCGDREVERR